MISFYFIVVAKLISMYTSSNLAFLPLLILTGLKDLPWVVSFLFTGLFILILILIVDSFLPTYPLSLAACALCIISFICVWFLWFVSKEINGSYNNLYALLMVEVPFKNCLFLTYFGFFSSFAFVFKSWFFGGFAKNSDLLSLLEEWPRMRGELFLK